MIIIDWGDADETMIIMKFIGQWTTRQYRAAMVRRNLMILSKSHPVATIADLRQSGSIPRDILKTAITVAQFNTPNSGQVSVITNHPIWSQLSKLVMRFSGTDSSVIRFVHTVEDAYFYTLSHP